ncbi:hypothetical protein, partial, partial [Absidia glauca]
APILIVNFHFEVPMPLIVDLLRAIGRRLTVLQRTTANNTETIHGLQEITHGLQVSVERMEANQPQPQEEDDLVPQPLPESLPNPSPGKENTDIQFLTAFNQLVGLDNGKKQLAYAKALSETIVLQAKIKFPGLEDNGRSKMPQEAQSWMVTAFEDSCRGGGAHVERAQKKWIARGLLRHKWSTKGKSKAARVTNTLSKKTPAQPSLSSPGLSSPSSKKTPAQPSGSSSSSSSSPSPAPAQRPAKKDKDKGKGKARVLKGPSSSRKRRRVISSQGYILSCSCHCFAPILSCSCPVVSGICKHMFLVSKVKVIPSYVNRSASLTSLSSPASSPTSSLHIPVAAKRRVYGDELLMDDLCDKVKSSLNIIDTVENRTLYARDSIRNEDKTARQAQEWPYSSPGIRSNKKTHINCGSSARMGGNVCANVDQIRRQGRWKNTTMEGISHQPSRELVQSMAGFPTYGRFFYLARAALDPPTSLCKKLFPAIGECHDRLAAKELSPGDPIQPTVAENAFVQVIMIFRKTFIQDSVLMMELHPCYPIWQHSIFSDLAYLSFKR